MIESETVKFLQIYWETHLLSRIMGLWEWEMSNFAGYFQFAICLLVFVEQHIVVGLFWLVEVIKFIV